jgi:GTPase SAR1 family protein
MTVPLTSSSSRSEVREFLADTLRQLEELAPLDAKRHFRIPTSFASVAKVIADLSARYEDPLRLAIVGEFNAGKSALINALLGRPGLIPEGATPTTGAVTEIWWSATESSEVLDASGTSIFQGTLEEGKRFADQRTPQGKSIDGKRVRVLLRINADLLRNLIILDTPGLGASQEDDTIALNTIHLADAAILVLSGRNPGGEDSVTLSERLRRTQRKLILAVTRIDLLRDPNTACEAAKAAFGSVAEGDPIGVSPPLILKALAALKDAELRSNREAQEAASQELAKWGYFALRERIQEAFLNSDATVTRAATTLPNVHHELLQLQSDAAKESAHQHSEAEKLAAEASEAHRRVADVLRPKKAWLGAKIEEIVDRHMSEFLSDLSDAFDVFIDRVADGGILLGIRTIFAKFDDEKQKRFQQELREDFATLFPEEQVKIVASQIESSALRMMELEWQVIARDLSRPGLDAAFSADTLVKHICDHVAQVTVAVTAETAAMIALLFIPGGALIDAAIVLLSWGAGKYLQDKEPARISRAKRESRTRVRSMRRQTVYKLSEHYKKVSDDTAEDLIRKSTQAGSRKEQERTEHADLAEEWRQAQTHINGLMEVCEGLARKRATA